MFFTQPFDAKPLAVFIGVLQEFVGKLVEKKSNDVIEKQQLKDLISRLVILSVSYLVNENLVAKCGLYVKSHYFHPYSPWRLSLWVNTDSPSLKDFAKKWVIFKS